MNQGGLCSFIPLLLWEGVSGTSGSSMSVHGILIYEVLPVPLPILPLVVPSREWDDQRQGKHSM